MDTVLGESKFCTDHRELAYWAVDSPNSNAASIAQCYLGATAANVVFLLELRVDGHRLLTAQRTTARARWSLAVEPARRTEAGSQSAGVGVAVRTLATLLSLTWLCWNAAGPESPLFI